MEGRGREEKEVKGEVREGRRKHITLFEAQIKEALRYNLYHYICICEQN